METLFAVAPPEEPRPMSVYVYTVILMSLSGYCKPEGDKCIIECVNSNFFIIRCVRMARMILFMYYLSNQWPD